MEVSSLQEAEKQRKAGKDVFEGDAARMTVVVEESRVDFW
jgi:hypothetical protein